MIPDGVEPRYLLAMVGVLQRHAVRHMTRELEPMEMTPVEGIVLMILRGRGEVSLGELAEMWGVSPPVMSRMVDGLVRRGLVRRAPAEEDRRRMEISLTEEGIETAKAVQRMSDEAGEVMTCGFDEDEKSQLREYLRRALESLVENERSQG